MELITKSGHKFTVIRIGEPEAEGGSGEILCCDKCGQIAHVSVGAVERFLGSYTFTPEEDDKHYKYNEND
jgi:hypothetical protein